MADVDGARVLMPDNASFATVSVVLAAGAEVDFLDMEMDGLGLDPIKLSARLAYARNEGIRIGAVVVVHTGGFVSPHLDEIVRLCDAHGVALIEDAAHALGSGRAGRRAGSFGRMAAFSFDPTEIVTRAEGGIVAARDPADAKALRMLRDHGKLDSRSNVHGLLGSNWRMSEAHAAIGIAQLTHLDAFVDERRALADQYNYALTDCPGLRAFIEPRGGRANYYKYIALLDPGIDRTAFKRALGERHDISLCGGVYETLCSAQPALAGHITAAETPVSAIFADRHVCLPICQGMRIEEVDWIVAAIRCEIGKTYTGRAA